MDLFGGESSSDDDDSSGSGSDSDESWSSVKNKAFDL